MADDTLFSLSPFNCAIEFRNVFRRLHREWSRHVDPYGMAVLYMVLDRTLSWGKEFETITMSHFTNGIVSRDDGELVHPGTGLGHSTVRKWLAQLVANGMLLTQERSNHRTAYALNLTWKPSMLRTPRNVKSRPTGVRMPRGVCETEGSPLPDRGHGVCATKGEKILKEKDTTLNIAEAPLSAMVVEQTRERHRTRTELEFTRAMESKAPDAAQCLTIWRDTFRDTFPDAPALTWKEKDLHILRAYSRRWTKAQHPDTFGTFLKWCVTYWRAICHAHFRNMKAVPDLPAIGFFVAMSERFEVAYSDRAELEKRLTMTTRQSQIAKLTTSGVPQEIAEQEVDDRSGATRRTMEAEAAEGRMIEQRERLRRAQESNALSRPRPMRPPPPPVRVVRPETIQEQYLDMPEDFGPFKA